jgi:hypothetical protein
MPSRLLYNAATGWSRILGSHTRLLAVALGVIWDHKRFVIRLTVSVSMSRPFFICIAKATTSLSSAHSTSLGGPVNGRLRRLCKCDNQPSRTPVPKEPATS